MINGCIFIHLHKTKLAVASSDKINPRECEDCYCCGTTGAGCSLLTKRVISDSRSEPKTVLVQCSAHSLFSSRPIILRTSS
ncbi:hypothetical protein FRH59_05170 [Salmonella enterica]|uniref:Uncharacterized protein n=1 Tax=Salmonella enterica subsp. enterica serovar Poona TaxID=436295 RepID=A0A625LFR7_SALET|nr:hypothetical protein [Salmonella enterica]EBG0082211.1 hypothetical protein [Salmonella enterica subsp. enterica serovar Poona]EDV5435278.1 hypothetical protein [Salmonella enterica subsp. enterica]EED8925921.1 hypothetical protein [Salmonella enterica subsp. enterica serovar O rough]EAQ4299638.1 hypothetical protein [Salmonella enterica]